MSLLTLTIMKLNKHRCSYNKERQLPTDMFVDTSNQN